MARSGLLERIHPGMKVYASDGSHVGEVLRVTGVSEGGAHLPERAGSGWIETTRDAPAAGRFYIPLDGIADVRGQSVYLAETEAGAYARGWDRPPAAQG